MNEDIDMRWSRQNQHSAVNTAIANDAALMHPRNFKALRIRIRVDLN